MVLGKANKRKASSKTLRKIDSKDSMKKEIDNFESDQNKRKGSPNIRLKPVFENWSEKIRGKNRGEGK